MTNVRIKPISQTLSFAGNKKNTSKSILDFAGIFKNDDFIDIERIAEERNNFSLGRVL